MSRPNHASLQFALDLLEHRRLLSVTAFIRVLGKETTIRAGQSVHVAALAGGKAMQTQLGAGSPITAKFEWDFGDTSATSKYNQLPGFNAGHVYDTPGSYVIRLNVTNELGEPGTTHKTIRVLPDNRRPIYLSKWGNDNSNGLTRSKAVGTLGRALQLLGSDTKLLFRRGETFKIPFALAIPYQNVLIGAYGPGKPPILQIPKNIAAQNPGVFLLRQSSHQVTIQDLALESLTTSYAGEAIRPAGSNIVIRNVAFRHFNTAIMNNQSPVGVLAHDNVAGVLAGYFIYDDGSDHVYLGNKANDSVWAHNVRIYASRVLCFKNDLTNKPAHSGINGLRVNGGSQIYWAQNILRGAPMMVGALGPTAAGATPRERVDTVVIENNQLLAVKKIVLGNDRIDIRPGATNVMVRNNYIVANHASGIAVQTYVVERFPGQKKNTRRATKNIIVVNNTSTNGSKEGCFIAVYGAATGVITLKNNLYVAPRLVVGPYATSAVRVLGREDLNNFTTLASGGGVDGNVWPKPAHGDDIGVNYVSNKAEGNRGYRTPKEWAADFPGIVGDHERYDGLSSTDLSATLAPPLTSIVAGASQPVPGVFTDIDGNPRPADAAWTAGAVQILPPVDESTDAVSA